MTATFKKLNLVFLPYHNNRTPSELTILPPLQQPHTILKPIYTLIRFKDSTYLEEVTMTDLRTICRSNIIRFSDVKKLDFAEYVRIKLGVTILSEESLWVTRDTIDKISIGEGTLIMPNVYLFGDVSIGKECVIWPNIIMCNTSVGDRTICGRPNYTDSIIGEDARVGQFTELVRTELGKGSWAQHWSYLGDTTTGKNVEVAAGVVTANYDGGAVKKKTLIGDGAFIGILSCLIAPLEIGAEALVGAGAIIRKKVLAHTIVVGNDRVLPNRFCRITQTGWEIIKSAIKKKK